jgi:hypothetical protein
MPFKVARVEVWGCGSADDLSGQERERLRDHQASEQRQKVSTWDACFYCGTL